MTTLDLCAVRQSRVLRRNKWKLINFKNRKEWLNFFKEKVIWPSYFLIEHKPNSNVPFVQHERFFSMGSRKWPWLLFSDDFSFFSFSINWVFWQCLCYLAFFYFRKIFRQATLVGNLLPLFPYEYKTTTKTVPNFCFKNCARLVKSWPTLDSRLAMN